MLYPEMLEDHTLLHRKQRHGLFISQPTFAEHISWVRFCAECQENGHKMRCVLNSRAHWVHSGRGMHTGCSTTCTVLWAGAGSD